MSQCELPLAFQRMPPVSQIERSKPQVQRIIQLRETACMSSAHARGTVSYTHLTLPTIYSV